jgi:hypothetical protein
VALPVFLSGCHGAFATLCGRHCLQATFAAGLSPFRPCLSLRGRAFRGQSAIRLRCIMLPKRSKRVTTRFPDRCRRVRQRGQVLMGIILSVRPLSAKSPLALPLRPSAQQEWARTVRESAVANGRHWTATLMGDIGRLGGTNRRTVRADISGSWISHTGGVRGSTVCFCSLRGADMSCSCIAESPKVPELVCGLLGAAARV